MGTFSIEPKRLSTITCGLGENSTSDYQVIPSTIDMKESERIEMVYSRSGALRGFDRASVDATFEMVIFGSTLANALSNVSTLSRALAHPDGGYIQYKPIGLDSAMSTYYHYLPSPPVQVQGTGQVDGIRAQRYGQSTRTNEYSVFCKVVVRIKSWATSDPESIQTIKSSEGIENADGGADDCSIIVDSSAIKGDAVIPIIRVTATTGAAYDPTRVLIHKRKMRTSSNTNLDWIEGEAMTGSGWTIYADGTASGGSCIRSNAATLSDLLASIPAMDSTYLGKIAPVICAKVSSSTEYQLQCKLLAGSREVEATGYDDVDSTSWMLYYGFGGLHLPPIPLQSFIQDDTSPTIANYISANLQVGIDGARTAGSDYIFVDFIILPKSNEWIAVLENDTNALDGGQTNYLDVDAISNGVFLRNTSHYLVDTWAKKGMPVSSLILERGFDHRIRVLTFTSTAWDETWTQNVAIYGIYATIFPFDES